MESEIPSDPSATKEPDKKRLKTSTVPRPMSEPESNPQTIDPEKALNQDKSDPLSKPISTIKKTAVPLTRPTVASFKPIHGTNTESTNVLVPNVPDKKQTLPSTKSAPKPKAPHTSVVKAGIERTKDKSIADTTSIEKETEKSQSALPKKPTNDAKAAAKIAALKAAEASALASERLALENDLENIGVSLTSRLESIEADIEIHEEEYITQTWAHGNVMRGWDGFVRRVDKSEKTATGNGSGTATGAPKHRKSRPSDRIFSLSSSSSNFRRENPDAITVKRPGGLKKKKKR